MTKITLQFLVFCDSYPVKVEMMFDCEIEDTNKLVSEVATVCAHIEREANSNLSLYDFINDVKSESHLTPWAINKVITVFYESSVSEHSFDITSRLSLVRKIKCVEIVLSHNANIIKK